MKRTVIEGRTALAVTVLLIATVTVPTIVMGGVFSLAQSQPSPSGTAPQIELLNPSDHSNVLSDKDSDPSNDSSPNPDPTDTQYHFNAWARNIPPNPLVEFFVIQGNTTFLLGSTSGGGTDTFDVFAAIPNGLTETTLNAATGAPEGNTATVRAVLYSNNGAQEVDRDEQTVVVNQSNPGSDPLMRGPAHRENAAETIEMVYPLNRGGMGFFTQQGQDPTGTVDVTTSASTDDVDVQYTISPVGTEPEWKDCNSTDETQANSADGVRCTLESGDRPDQVTGMAVVAMDDESSAPNGQNPESVANAGDAHRAVGFEQVPNSVSVTSHSVAAGSMPGCSPVVTVTVLDGGGHAVTNAQIDVHAQGPSDNVWFNTHDAETDAAGDPDPNDPPENHTTENGRRCSDGTFGGTQGNHAVGGGFDRKHIESTNRTDDNGEFTYRMYGEVPGGTTMTAWVDKDDDDRFCATERDGSGTITWGSGGPAAPAPEGAELQTCPAPSPSPSPSGTQTGSPTASPTQSASPTASPTGSASPSPSPSGSASPSPSPSRSVSPSGSATPSGTTPSGPTPTGTGTTGGGGTSPQQAAVEVTIETSQPRKTFGRSFTLTGSVTSDNPACSDLVTVQIHRDVVGGEDDFELFAQETTDANGAYSVTDRADRSASYIARVAETASCDSATSDPQPVLVRTKVTLSLSRNRVEKGQKVRFTIKTAPCPLTARDRVLLFRAIEGEFGKAGRKETDGRCVAAIVRRVNKSSVYQARWPKQTPELLSGRSRSKAVRVTD